MSRRRAVGVCVVAFLALLVTGCSTVPAPAPEPQEVVIEEGSTDQMFRDQVSDAELYVLQDEGVTLTADHLYAVDVMADEPLRDGCFYRVVADVTYVNGGVAGYVDYPEVGRVRSCEEVSPFDMGLPSLGEARYGLTLIGDYADGDVLCNEVGLDAVWKGGAWVWHYDRDLKLDDGREALVRDGVTQDDVQAGMESGVLSCEDYFVMPAES